MPTIAPAILADASAVIAAPILGSLPSGVSRFAFRETPMSVPMVSNMLTNISAKIRSHVSARWSIGYQKSIAIKVFDIDSGMPTTADGVAVSVPFSVGTNAPISVSVTIDIKMAPVTRFTISTIVKMIPARASITAGSERSPSCTNVAGLSTISPAFLRPIKAMNKPMPHCTPILSDGGIDSAIFVRTPVNDSIRKRIPFQKTIPNAASHGISRPRQMVNAKKAFKPMPGANAIG